MNILKKRQAAGYTGAYLLGKGAKPKAARVNVTVAAFINRFVNGSWTWTRYFCAAILENTKLLAKRELCPCKNQVRKDAVISVSIGAKEVMISFRKIYEIKNVIYKIRTNPQAA